MQRGAPALLLIALSVLACGRRAEPEPSAVSGGLGVPRGGAPLAFTEIGATAGLDFRHDPGATGRRYAAEQLGAGGALFDADGDGDLDLLCLNGGPLPGAPAPKENRLFLNDGRGRFGPSPDLGDLAAGADYAVGCAVSDVDLDGDLDVLVTNLGPDRLYLNDGSGRFRSAPGEGLGGARWSASAAFGDLDGDGLADLWITGYLDWSLDRHRPCFRGTVPVYCGPQQCSGVSDGVYRNLGDGRFEDVTAAWLDVPPDGKGLGVVMFDPDDDGDLDVYVANDQTPNLLYENLAPGRLVSIGDVAGCALSREGAAEAGMGVAAADLDGDGLEDLVVTNFEDQTNALYRNEGSMLFLESSWEAGLGFATRPDLGWGIVAQDFDLDGDRDLFVANGHVYDNAALLRDSSSFEQKDRVFRNDGRGVFAEAALPGPALALARASRGAAWGDLDGDGDPDLVVFDWGDRPRILRNDAGGSSVLVSCLHEGAATPVDGAAVEIVVGGRSLRGRVQTSAGFATASDPRVHFGLDRARRIDKLRVRWPGGAVREWRGLPIQAHLVARPGGRLEIRGLGTSKTLEVRTAGP